jgi:hypothetical protein
MAHPAREAYPETRDERRRELRISFLPSRRPQVQLDAGSYPVLDASSRGLRIRHTDPVRPEFGADISGSLVFQDGRPPLTFEGVITRVQTADVAISCSRETIPPDWLREEASYLPHNR